MKLYISLLLFVFTTSVQADFTFTPLEPYTIATVHPPNPKLKNY